MALLVGAAAVISGALAGLAIGILAVGAELNVSGLARLAATTLLLAAGLGAVAALLVAWLRSRAAVAAMAILVGGSYLLVLVVQLFSWPEWVTRLSLFGAFGHPYLQVPAVAGLVFLAALATAGGVLAAAVAQHSPKTS